MLLKGIQLSCQTPVRSVYDATSHRLREGVAQQCPGIRAEWCKTQIPISALGLAEVGVARNTKSLTFGASCCQLFCAILSNIIADF